ncbi:TRAP transporter small permease [Mesorhizobium sp. CAU 1741]|uniref:TRAP transporter small permease n=1 Tax=Mesorhizobium sp. CAU 1741 TaxID=3140366 RepID=UPI00325AAD33
MSTKPRSAALGAAEAAMDRLGMASSAIATAIIWLLAITVTYDVILRTLAIPTLWAAEVSIYMMIAMAFLGAGATQMVDGHFRVTFLRDLCPAPVRLAMDYFALALSFAFAVAFTYGAWQAASFSWMLDFRTSTMLQVPMWILQGLMVAGGVLLSLATLRDLIMVSFHGVAHRDRAGPNEVV